VEQAQGVIHHLNCATMCPCIAPPLGLVDRDPGHLVARCLLIEDASGLVLIDTAFGTKDIATPSRLGPARFLIAPRLDPSETAISQIRALGHDPRDVRHILVTHLDLDHAGGLGDFPDAQVHVHAAELEIMRRRPRSVRLRYRPAHWEHGPRWADHAEAGEPWFGFERVKLIEGLDTEIAMIPLFGHTAGHSGYAIRAGDRWLLHAGDAYLRQGEIASPRQASRALDGYHVINSDNARRRRENADRLASLARDEADRVTVFCSHDPGEFARDSRVAPPG
jgi:glyoxylase-like metal-dependent hydrolase (beta-lactamase superfamily II)